jgi:E3 ubiquitin-protein ligase UBR7
MIIYSIGIYSDHHSEYIPIIIRNTIPDHVTIPMSTLQLSDLLASQQNLIKQAALALPHDFKHCTYILGSLRQAVYLCIPCSQLSGPRGICSACSIACHTDHDQIELFPKRNFRCDCPTAALSHPCSLHHVREDPNEYNTYGQNFRALFCRCGRTYDATKERETMIQCLACEVGSIVSTSRQLIFRS